MKRNPVKVTITLDKKFWADWQNFSDESGMSASLMFETIGKVILKSKKKAFNIFDEIYSLGIAQGKGEKSLKLKRGA